MQIPAKKGESVLFAADEHPRPDTTMEGLAEAQTHREIRRDRDSGQRVGFERWRGPCWSLAGERAANGNGLTPTHARVVASAVAPASRRA